MRCLYCGKGLALLKRLRGGGEFCSDAHRLQYQEEYNQLALSRLLQAQVPEDAREAPAASHQGTNGSAPAPQLHKEPATAVAPAKVPAVKPAQPVSPRPVAPAAVKPAPAAQPMSLQSAATAVATTATVEAPPVAREPEPVARIDAKPPAPEAWFVKDLPKPCSIDLVEPDLASLELVTVARLELPRREESLVDDFAEPEGTPPVAGRIALAVPGYAKGTGFAIRAAHIEEREPSRHDPITLQHSALELQSCGPGAQSEEGGSSMQWSLKDRPMDFAVSPIPPLEKASQWLSSAEEFGAPGIELGDLGRLALAIEASVETEEREGVRPTVEEPELPEQETQDPQHAPTAPMSIEPQRHETAPAARTVIEPVQAPQVHIDPAFLQSLAKLEPVQPRIVQPVAEPSASSPAVETASPIPDRVTRPLPLTLHGFPPPRVKGQHVFTTAPRAVPEIQIPQTSALPLRPVMFLAPAPPEPQASSAQPATDSPVEEPKKTRTENRKASRTQSKPAADAAKGKTPEAAAPSETKSDTDAKPEQEPKPEPKLDKLPEPLAAPVTSVDLGLPSLQLDAASKSRTSPAVIAGVLAVVVALGVGVYKLGFKTTTPAQSVSNATVSDVVETGTPLSVAESGWIDDWAPQPPNPKVLRVLSILRGSMQLSDYRMEFESQIESKAVGWVFRALNQKTYYVTKLEVVKPGIEPAVDVVHFAMIDGEEQPRSRQRLPIKVRVDTTYKIRFEALGDRFTTYVQDQKVDEWRDNRIGRGGAGLYRERGESALLKGTVRMALIAKRK